jgi:hypothetical protein
MMWRRRLNTVASSLLERFCRTFGRSEQATPAQALVWFAIVVTVMIMCVAIVTDTGQIWMNRRFLQNAADAAALAGVQQLPNDASGARSVACDYATVKNAVAGMTVACDGADIAIYQTYAPNDTITVTTHKTIVPLIGGMFGWPDVDISADATAVIGGVYKFCPFPIFQTPDMLPGGSPDSLQFYTLTALHLAGADNQKGNFLTVDVGSGANAVLDAMTSTDCTTPVDTMNTEPGAKIGKVVDGFQWRIYCAGGGGSQPNRTPACPSTPSACPSPDITQYLVDTDPGPGVSMELDPAINLDNCLRLVMLPIFPGPFTGYNGNETVTVEGWALYYIAGVCPPHGQAQTCPDPTGGPDLHKGDSWGYYVRKMLDSPEIRPYDGFGTKVAVLID